MQCSGNHTVALPGDEGGLVAWERTIGDILSAKMYSAAGHGMLGYASLGALAACVLLLIIGMLVHKPLSTAPENSLKFVVGLMLSAFGIFWMGEGIGAEWPGADLSLLPIFGILALFSFVAVRMLRRYYNSHMEAVAR